MRPKATREIGKVLTANAWHNPRPTGLKDIVEIKGDWDLGIHVTSVSFLNDAWGGTVNCRSLDVIWSPEQAQRFLSTHGVIYGHFCPRRHLMTAAQYRRAHAKAFRIWRQETCAQVVA